ncbi:GGDEF domain-containing protein [Magnetofaba australis]|nr:GGDEF domain-containing protein [Magnetofaba australis]
MPSAAEPSRPQFQWTIARKVGGLSAVLIFFTLLLLIYSIVTLYRMQGEIGEISRLDLPLTELTNQMEIAHLERQIAMDMLLRLARGELPANPQHTPLQETHKRLQRYSATLNERLSVAATIAQAGYATPSKVSFMAIHQALQEMDSVARKQAERFAAMADDIEAGRPLNVELLAKVEDQETALDHTLERLIDRVESFTERDVTLLSAHESDFLWVNAILGASAVVLGGILTGLVIISIRSNIFRITRHVSDVTQAIVENRPIPAAPLSVNSSDEIGHLAERLSHLVDNLSSNFQKRDELSRHLKKVATTDALTGAFNRVKWDEDQKLAMERARRGHDALSVIMLDIDHFKSVNDTYGHDVGDAVLVETVKRTQQAIRQIDSFYRTGGEEFIILAPSTDLDQARILADKIRLTMADTPFETVGAVTISLGCAQFDRDGDDDVEKLLKRADQALYRAKEGGRNQVCA